MKGVALCPGSFDPITVGHAALIRRVSALYDTVYVAVADNEAKQYDFSAEQRLSLCRKTLSDLDNVQVIRCDGLLVDTFRRVGADVIVKGVRNAGDYEYERKMAEINRSLEPTAETVFLFAEQAMTEISSSELQRRLKEGRDSSEWIPQQIKNEILNRYVDSKENET